VATKKAAAKKEAAKKEEPPAPTEGQPHEYVDDPTRQAAGGVPGTDSVAPAERAFPEGFVTITKGDYKGTYGALVDVFNNEKGEPDTALVRTRDNDHALVSVPYDDLEPAPAGQR